jgi:hypothetical protein
MSLLAEIVQPKFGFAYKELLEFKKLAIGGTLVVPWKKV